MTDAAAPPSTGSPQPRRHSRSSPRRRELSFGLPPWRRLRTTRDFTRVERQGVRASGTWVAVTVRPGPGRVGFVVSKKVDNRAVVRNLVKRRLRSIVRHEKPLYARRAEGAVDVVVAARPEAKDAAFAALHADVVATLQAALARLADTRTAPPRRRR